jgi:hypothetical protein
MRETTVLAPVWGKAPLPLPGVGGLTADQQRGATCVWCTKHLTAETAVDLGERRIRVLDGHVTAFPRGCRPHTVTAARRAITDHAQRCEQCVEDPDLCPTYGSLRNLIREATSRPWTAADIAFRYWLGHTAACRVCKVDEGRCERGAKLRYQWRQVRREGWRTSGTLSA